MNTLQKLIDPEQDSVNSASVPVADVQRENSEDCDCDKKDGLKQDDTLKTSTDNNILTIAEVRWFIFFFKNKL